MDTREIPYKVQFLASKRFWEVSSQLEIVGEAEPLSEERHTSLTAGGLKKGSPKRSVAGFWPNTDP